MVIGAAGQIGSELTLALRAEYGAEQVFATDIKMGGDDLIQGGPFQILDVMNDKMLIHFIIRNKITQIYNLAAVLSGNAEKLPIQAWNINMDSLLNILEISRMVESVHKVFWPSSIAVFGPSTQKEKVPQLTVMEPSTVYGITKLAGERWCEYYHRKYNIDVRSLRYPGLISYKTEAGGGTTDYAVEIFYEAIKNGKYDCFIKEDTYMPFLFMPDAIKATIQLMQTPRSALSVNSSYNIAGYSHCPEDFAEQVKRFDSSFTIKYKPDFRSVIAENWPNSIDDSLARKDWGFHAEYDITKMSDIMMDEVDKKIS